GLDAAVFTYLTVLFDTAALGELRLTVLTGTLLDFVKTAVMDIQQNDKNKARWTKPSTGIERVQEIEAEGVYILNGPTRSYFIRPG
ncbi:hypothetical protein Tco_0023324, partial [Tanacetum coccineum]